MLDAFAEKRFLAPFHSKQRPLPVVLFGPFGRHPWPGDRRNRLNSGRRRIPLDQSRIVIGGAIDRGGNFVGLQQILGRRRDQPGGGLRINVCAIEPQIEGFGWDDHGHPFMNAVEAVIGTCRHDGGRFHFLAIGTSPSLPESGKRERLARLCTHIKRLLARPGRFPFIKAVSRNKFATIFKLKGLRIEEGAIAAVVRTAPVMQRLAADYEEANRRLVDLFHIFKFLGENGCSPLDRWDFGPTAVSPEVVAPFRAALNALRANADAELPR